MLAVPRSTYNRDMFFQSNTNGDNDQDGQAEDRTARSHESGAADFPTQFVAILVICMALNCYTLANLFPYVGLMVKDLLQLQTTNEAGMIMCHVHDDRIDHRSSLHDVNVTGKVCIVS